MFHFIVGAACVIFIVKAVHDWLNWLKRRRVQRFVDEAVNYDPRKPINDRSWASIFLMLQPVLIVLP
jgi:hypothetical protein